MSTVRIGDAERDAAVTALADHYAAGRITKDEFDERSTRASAARFDDDLAPLFADLPVPSDDAARRASSFRSGTTPVRGRWSPEPAARVRRSPHRRGPAPFVPLAAVVIIALAVFTGTPWLLFGLFWVCALSGARHARRPGHGTAAYGRPTVATSAENGSVRCGGGGRWG